MHFDQIYPIIFLFPFLQPFKTIFNGFHYSVFIHAYKILRSYSLPLITLSFCTSSSHNSPHKVPILHACHCVCRFCVWERTFDICLSQSGAFCLTWKSLVPFIFLQMTQFHSSLWPNNTPLSLHALYSLSAHEIISTWANSMVWLLWIVQVYLL
jgi:hypothetical protein